jgi:hypothetical protein
MVSVHTLHYNFERVCHRLHTSIEKDVSAVDIDSYLNKAKNILLNRYDQFIQINREFSKILKDIEVHDKELKLFKSNSEYSLYKLPDNYYNYLRVNLDVFTDKCTDRQAIRTTTYVTQDTLNETLKDSFRNPSWYFRRCLYTFVDDKIKIYHNSKYKIDNVKLSYIRWIPDVAAASLSIKGKYLLSDQKTVITEDIDLDVSERSIFWDRMVDIAAYLFKKDVDDNYKVDLESYLFNQNLGVN